MKLIWMNVKGLPVLEDDLTISFYALQRVRDKQETNLNPVLPNVFLNRVSCFIGLNASGKSTILQVLDFDLHLLNQEPLNYIASNRILQGIDQAVFDMIFLNNQNQICRLVTKIGSVVIRPGLQPRYIITDENLFIRKSVKNIQKAQLCSDSCYTSILKRTGQERYLPDDVSLIIAMNRKAQDGVFFRSRLFLQDSEVLISGDIPDEIIQFLDPHIKSIKTNQIDNDNQIRVRLQNNDEMLISRNNLDQYLSSGTIIGIRMFQDALAVLQHGGYLLIDDIEMNLNYEIASALIRFFMDPEVNCSGAGMIFSTNNPDFLDEFSRNDSIWITCRNTAVNLSGLLHRNDIKKSEAYRSGTIGETAPMYESYMNLKKKMKAAVNKKN